MTLAMVLLATGFSVVGVLLEPQAAQARYASGGVGLHKQSIDWFEWGTPGQAIPAAGLTRTNTRIMAGETLATTCTLSNLTGGALQAYRSGEWQGDALDDLYNIGGTGLSNQMVAGLANTVDRQSASFRFACSVTLNGVPVPLQGLVVADAEASNDAANTVSGIGEYVQARPEQPATWRIIDRFRGPNCATSTQAILSANGTMRFAPNGEECVTQGLGGTQPGPMAVGFMEGATSAVVSLQGGGKSAVALGVVIQADFGDAPISYGAAGALFEPTWQGGTVPVGTTAVSGSGFALATQGQPLTRLGASTDAEGNYQASAAATGDDATGQADEDAIAPLGTVNVTPGQTYTLENVRCTGPGYVTGWIDWNHNGAFDDGEQSGVTQCSGTSVNLSWTVPADTVPAEGAVKTFLRLRIAADDVAVSSPTGMTTSGEVEDYALNVAVPQLSIQKSSNATADARPGDTVTYTVTATNTGASDYTANFPAVVFDDLSGVLDDATYNNNGAANRPGPVSYASPLLSWTGALGVGQSVELTYTVTLKAGGDGSVRNVAWAPRDPENPETPVCDPPEDGVDPVTGEPCAETEFLLPKLTIEKTANRTELPAVGEIVEYTITVTNVGPGAYTADAPATMTDDLSNVVDAGTFNDDAESSTGTVSYNEPTLSWSGVLAANESATITYTVTYTGEGDQNLRNIACLPASETAPGAPSCDAVQIPGAGLSQWKQVQASATPAVAGTVLTYTLFFSNDGGAAADVDAVDDLTHVTDDADVSAEPSSSDGLSVTRVGNRISITGSVPAGETYTVTYQVTVKADGERGDDTAANFLLAPNEETPTDPTCDPADDQFPDCTTTPIAAVVYSKAVSADSDPVVAGAVLTYTVTVQSTGTATTPVSREDVLTDVLDDADLTTDPSSDTASVTVSAVTSGRFTIGGQLAAGATAVITYKVTVKADADRGNNTADNFLVPPGGTPPQECAEGSDQCTSTPIPLIQASKSSDPESEATVVAGQDVTYTLTFANSGKAAGAVDYIDDLTGVLDDASLTAGPTPSDGALTASLNADNTLHVTGVLAAGQSVTVTYTVTVLPDGQRGNNRLGNVLAPAAATDPQCGDDGVSCTEHPVPQLESWKSVEADTVPVAAGTVLTYTLFFENTGQAAAVVDEVDDLTHVTDDTSVTSEPTSADGLTVSRVGNRISITGSVPAGATYTVSYQTTVKPDGERGDDIAANFLLSPDEQPPTEPVCQPEDGERPDCTVTPIGRLLTGKSVAANTNPVDVGTVLTYTLTFDNQGEGPIDVDHTDILTDVLDDADLTTPPTASNGALTASEVAGGQFSVTGELGAGQVVTVTYQVTVRAEADRGNNTADNFLVPTGEEPPGECVDGDPNCTVTPLPLIEVAKSADPESGSDVQGGQEVTYTLTFTNTGKAEGTVDYTDNLAAVLDDADLTASPVSSDPALTPTSGEDGLVRVTGTLEPGQTVTVSYTVTVKPDGNRGDNRLRNVVAKTGTEDPQCGDDGVVCTEHPIGELDDWKTVDPASGSTLRPGEVATYTLHFENTGQAPVDVNRDDVLTKVLDDADVTGQPTTSSDMLTASAIENGRFTVTGTLQPGQVVTVTYSVTVKPDGQRGDDRLDNFLVPNGEAPPESCVPADGERPDCTYNHVSDVTVAKSSDPKSGTKVNVGEKVTYTLTFTNRGVNTDAADVPVDYTDHMADVLDDASLTAGPTTSNGDLAALVDGDTIRITGTVPTGETYTVIYTVTVKAYGAQGNHRLGNVVAITGEAPVCAPNSVLCTQHDVPPPARGLLPSTGADLPAAVLIAGILLLGAGGGVLLISIGRRRRSRLREEEMERMS